MKLVTSIKGIQSLVEGICKITQSKLTCQRLCKKQKLACFNFNALILDTGTNSHNLALVFSLTMNQNLTRRHAEQAHVKTSHVIYVYRAI